MEESDIFSRVKEVIGEQLGIDDLDISNVEDLSITALFATK